MKLKNYLAMSAVKQKDFAEKIGVSEVAVTNYCYGNRVPKPPVMRKIFEATGGLVDANSFFDLPSTTPTGSAAVDAVVGSDPTEGENADLSKSVCCRASDSDCAEREDKKS